MKRVVIYARVSTSKQDTERQVDEIQKYCSSEGIIIQQVFSEQISGTAKNEDRYQLSAMIEFAIKEQIDEVIVWELSRLGRSTIEVLKTIEELNNRQICVYIFDKKLRTLNSDKKPDPMVSMFLTLLAEFAKLERIQIHERMQSGRAKYICNGGKMGRKVGYRKTEEQLLIEHADIVKQLRLKKAIRDISIITNKSTSTVQKVKKLIL